MTASALPPELEAWWMSGETVTLPVGESRRSVFVHSAGDGPAVTLLHGFPASSFEWAAVADALVAGGFRVITPDFLGYGASEKPPGHRYRLDEQVDLVRGVWRHLGVGDSAIVAYDYGAIIAQLLLGRTSSDAEVAFSRVIFLNASLYPELYRPRAIQRLAPIPGLGALIWRVFNETAFARAWAQVFGADHPLTPAVAHDHWVALQRGDPAGDAQRRLLEYIPERGRRASEITTSLGTDVPLSFLWGLADPVSGAMIATALEQRLADPDLVTYPGVGHCPHLEIPDQVAADILARLR